MANIARLFICEMETAMVWSAGRSINIIDSLNKNDYVLIYRTGSDNPKGNGSLAISDYLIDAGIAENIDVRKIRDEDFYEDIANQIMKYSDEETEIFLVYGMKACYKYIKEYLGDAYAGRIQGVTTLADAEAEALEDKAELSDDDDFLSPVADDEYAEETKHKHASDDEPQKNALFEDNDHINYSNEYDDIEIPQNSYINDDDDLAEKIDNDSIEEQQSKQEEPDKKNKKTKKEEVDVDASIPDTLFSVFGNSDFQSSEKRDLTKVKEINKNNHNVKNSYEEAEEYQRIREEERRKWQKTSAEQKKRKKRNEERINEEREEFLKKEQSQNRDGTQFGTQKGKEEQSSDKPTTAAKETREDILKQIFGGATGEQVDLKEYTELDDAKAKTISLLEDRLRKNINLLIMGFKDENPDDAVYIELISLLISANNFEDFLMCWYVTEPNYPLDGFGKQEYNTLKEESIYYSEACEILYGKDFFN